jgi:hypothetical protein
VPIAITPASTGTVTETPDRFTATIVEDPRRQTQAPGGDASDA